MNRSTALDVLLIAAVSLTVVSCLGPATEPSISLDDQGRMHLVNDNDVVITNISVKELTERAKNQQQTAEIRALKSLSCVKSAQKLVPEDGEADDRFGHAVAATDTMVVVGAHADDSPGTNVGSAYVFEKNDAGAYMQATKLVASDGASHDLFGFALAATESMVVVGALHDNDQNDNGVINKGSVYIFEKNNSGTFVQVDKLIANDGKAHDNFGSAVAATDNMLVIGARHDNDNGHNGGSAYVFEKNNAGAFVQVSKLVASDGVGHDVFGHAVAMVGSIVMVGSLMMTTWASTLDRCICLRRTALERMCK
eukprot:m.223079 g.223079  ORF g.223079 m.223079 type:complete len:310 (+) comp17263_c2_seq4:3041-3970(+)